MADKTPKAKAKTTGRDFPLAPTPDANFKRDSTNFSNAASKAAELIKKYDNPSYLMGGTEPSNQWETAKDSINAINSRRAGDSKFWKKMSK